MSYAANLQSIFRTLSGALHVPSDQQYQDGPVRASDSSQPSPMDIQHHHHDHDHDHDGEFDDDEEDDSEEDGMDEDTESSDEEQGVRPHQQQEQSPEDKEQEAKREQNQADMRKRIMLIQQDPSIPAADKARRIQELMTQGWQQKQAARTTTSSRVTNRLENRRGDFNILTEQDKQVTYHDKANGVLGCKHYQRAAKLQAHCCGKWDTCRFCHDEVSDHNIVRNLITTMMCMYCSTVQPAGQDCINDNCRRRVAKYYCKECKLWDSDPRKNIYHCYDCGICRIGKGLGIDYFHCKKCNVCMAISLKGRHKCIERNLESDCPICGEYMFTSTTTVIFMPCGHCIHYKCHQEYIQTSYQCPTCLKSLADMTDYFRRIDAALATQSMPPEYNALYNQIYCNDCEKKCFAKFHFMYHKCVTCKGYNTKVLHTGDGSQVPDDQRKVVDEMHKALLAGPAPQSAVSTSTTAQGGSGEQTPQQEAVVTGTSSNRRASMVQRGVTYWCHQCQTETNPVMVAGTERCVNCDSDFLEQL